MLPSQKNIHLLIVGNSHEHIFKIIDEFHPCKTFLISSIEIKDSTLELQNAIENLMIPAEIIWVDPFLPESLCEITKIIVKKGREILENDPDIKIFIGFTGDNIMAIAAGYSALILHAEAALCS